MSLRWRGEMEPMERWRALLRGDPIDRVPVFPLVSGYAAIAMEGAVCPKGWEASAERKSDYAGNQWPFTERTRAGNGARGWTWD